MNRTLENIKTLSNIFGDLCVGFSQFYTIDKYPDKACDIALSNDETTNKCKGISRILSMLNGKRNDAFLQVMFGHGTTDSTVKKGIDIVMDELKSEGSIEEYKALKDVKDKSSVDFKVTVEEVAELIA